MLLASQRLAAWATDGPLANASVAVLLADLAWRMIKRLWVT
jgi:hypothetical protein